jgi:hypothetical protein
MQKIQSARTWKSQTIKLSQDSNINTKANSYLKTKYNGLFNKYVLNIGGKGFVSDPSQSNQIVSEGQGFWEIIASRMPEVDPNSAKKFQQDFDLLLAGTKHMVNLAKQSGNSGEFPAWKVKVDNGNIKLDHDKWGPTANSASDADLDHIKSLIYAQKNVDKGIWRNNNYGKEALRLIKHATKALFTKENGVFILRPSEDWDNFHFTDYMSPATFKEIATFSRNNGMSKLGKIWEKITSDSIDLYNATLRDTGEFPAHVEFDVHSNKSIKATTVGNTTQTYDGIRSPWHIGEYIISSAESGNEFKFAEKALAAGKKNGYKFTHSVAMDKAMYLPLAMGLDAKEAVANLLPDVLNNKTPDSKYYENTLILLGVLTAFYPSNVDINPKHVTNNISLTVLTDTIISSPQQKNSVNTNAVSNSSNSSSFGWWGGWGGNASNFKFHQDSEGIHLSGKVNGDYFLGGNGAMLEEKLTTSHSIRVNFKEVSGDPSKLQLRFEIGKKEFGYDIPASTGQTTKVSIGDFKQVLDGWRLEGDSISNNELSLSGIKFKIGVTGNQNSGEYNLNVSHFQFSK